MHICRRVLPFGLLLLLAILVSPLSPSSALPLAVPAPATAQNGADDLTPPTNQIIIKYRVGALLERAAGDAGPAGAAQMARLSEAAGTPLTYFRPMSGDAHVLRLPARLALAEVQALADRLSALPEVQYAEPDAIMLPTLTPNDPRYGDQWHYLAPGSDHYGINAPAAWNITTGSASIVVAVVDTGITNHADLSGRTVAGYDFISEPLVANDGDGRDDDPSDPGDWITSAESSSGFFQGCQVRNSSWHGAHVAGTIGAASNNGIGVAGVNWNSRIQPVRVLGKCGGMISDIADGMRWAAGLSVPGAPANATPAKVINASLGGYGSCGSTYQDAVNEIIGAGVTAVIAAGNNNADAVNYRPGNCDGVITVAAANRNGSRASYSNYGTVVEISAPGGETNPTSRNGVLSTLNTGTQGPVDDTYTYYQGTSMAAPHVAGVASLLYSLNPAITPAQVLAILQSTVTPFPGGSTCNTSICGSGIVNAGAAVAAAAPRPTPTITELNPASATAGGPAFTLTVNGAGFVSSSVVRWNGANRTTTYVSGAQLTAQITAADIAVAGAANVTVFNPAPGGGASNVVSFPINNPAPTITGLSPSWATPGGAAFNLTVNGAGFVNGSVVRWKGSDRATTYVNSTQLTAAISASDIATAGTADVTVFNPAPGGGASNAATFTIGNPTPTITMLSPFWATPGGPDFSLTVNGAGFVNSSVVSWNGASRTTAFVSSMQLTATITAADIATAKTVSVTVFNPTPGGGVSPAVSFLVGAPKKVHLPVILRNFPPLPGVPTLNPINNANGDGNYTVSWTAAAGATSYTLQEDDNSSFTSPTVVYSGGATSWAAGGKAAGAYFYRVQGVNAWGGSGWSNTQSTIVNPAGGWTTIASMDFEGAWPGPWRAYDSDGGTNGEYYWGKRTCRVYAGSYSGWGVGAGAQGSGLACDADYPDNARSALDFGPFSLVGATAADLRFMTWFNTEPPGAVFYDYIGAFASIDGTNYYGTIWAGTSAGWIEESLDLSDVYTIGNLLGQPNVWVRLRFRSDTSVTYTEGAYVDNIVLRKCTSGSCPAATTEAPPDGSNIIESHGMETQTNEVILQYPSRR